ncbi:hypothetical protein [Paraferrimonas haliotis]|uniref:Cell wall-active antibiotics response LiaF-like C-terminal domain-containing protein n=1 Tax=Paraferrimonas haliotis TaxID=2013866 RepID=A0AA37TM35_9GAMM|nr:hypothetical protein [Paraferrimonas haliotis]GLS84037.1 hypothetical protein GCM10007894_20140 [Paraferrimonas haliotis]
MPVTPNDRPLNVVRDEVIDQLIMNYSHNELSSQAFERRLDIAMEANSGEALMALVEDLPLTTNDAYQQQKQQLDSAETAVEAEEVDKVYNILSGGNRGGVFAPAKQIKSTSILSAATMDFSDAQFQHPVVRIDIFHLLTGDTIYVPENVNVICKAFCVFGSIDNRAGGSGKPGQPTIIIEGFSLLSSLDIKIKRTIKERFVDFAEELKKMFS